MTAHVANRNRRKTLLTHTVAVFLYTRSRRTQSCTTAPAIEPSDRTGAGVLSRILERSDVPLINRFVER